MVRIATILAFALGVNAFTTTVGFPRNAAEKLTCTAEKRVDTGDVNFNKQSEIKLLAFNVLVSLCG
ncbi:hypothetical protein VFPPC_15728 [Pochonia chlamydosporia 170]|uniref:Uncharacterized protein n=1 Tax=Pochonia chlamydosporia 170 TaxID=1380566 RepID=A0A179FQA8_METCM|nr:hypothetical protein VFPPC_15728 [Pochonia chlamydosporia 170]OAQ67772.1 hypothetical protein VFPPC_15728 [Pochonia chlamydosporia 170]